MISQKRLVRRFSVSDKEIKDNVININGTEHKIDSMTDPQKYIIRQIRELQAQEERLAFQIDPIRVAKNAYTNALIKSLEERDEFKVKEDPTQ
tara:strand:+ start:817 stop:1095 length:279 start_codon:yes stop_codon:yes gene_type:complete